MEKTRKRRTVDEKLRDAQAEVARLHAQKRQEDRENALKDGLVREGCEAKFKKYQKYLKQISKAIDICLELDDSSPAAGNLSSLRTYVEDEMEGMIVSHEAPRGIEVDSEDEGEDGVAPGLFD